MDEQRASELTISPSDVCKTQFYHHTALHNVSISTVITLQISKADMNISMALSLSDRRAEHINYNCTNLTVSISNSGSFKSPI